MSTVRDQNGNVLHHAVRRDSDGTWSATVWFGGLFGVATNVRRLTGYRTRAQARMADISDKGNRHGT